MSLYIIEGPRNSGKTTIVKRLTSALPEGSIIPIKFQRTANPPQFMTEFLSKNYLALIDSRSICVLDRFHLTEFVMRSLDKKVPQTILMPTTHMIDEMLRGCGAITYIINTTQEVRDSRAKLRDVDHRQKEWPNSIELDEMWEKAQKVFTRCKTKVMKGNTNQDINAVVFDILKEQGLATTIGEKLTDSVPLIYEEVSVT